MDLKKRLDFLVDRKDRIIKEHKLGLTITLMNKSERKELAILKVITNHLETNSRSLRDELLLINDKKSDLPSTHRNYLLTEFYKLDK